MSQKEIESNKIEQQLRKIQQQTNKQIIEALLSTKIIVNPLHEFVAIVVSKIIEKDFETIEQKCQYIKEILTIYCEPLIRGKKNREIFEKLVYRYLEME